MKMVVFGGSGKIGRVAAWDLIQHEAVDCVGLVDCRLEALDRTRAWLNSSKVRPYALDVYDKAAVTALCRQFDVGVICLPDRRASYAVVEAAIEAGLNSVDVLEEYHRRPGIYETEGLEIPAGLSLDAYGERLHETAVRRGVTLLDGMGFAPGLSNVTVAEGIRQLDRAHSAIARVGGIPSKAAAGRHPLKYMITWSFEHVLREYMVKVDVRQNGEVVEVDATSELEAFHFGEFGQHEDLECAITPGMPSFLYTRPELEEFKEKTIRWPGHWQAIEVLKECGLLGTERLEGYDTPVVPREVLKTLLEPRLQPTDGDTDICVMWNTVRGEKAGQAASIDYHMWVESSPDGKISAMARATAFPASIGAILLGQRRVSATGIVAPEDAFDSDLYTLLLAELQKRGLVIQAKLTLGEALEPTVAKKEYER
jgi:lysine 6-dehydrogenase